MTIVIIDEQCISGLIQLMRIVIVGGAIVVRGCWCGLTPQDLDDYHKTILDLSNVNLFSLYRLKYTYINMF